MEVLNQIVFLSTTRADNVRSLDAAMFDTDGMASISVAVMTRIERCMSPGEKKIYKRDYNCNVTCLGQVQEDEPFHFVDPGVNTLLLSTALSSPASCSSRGATLLFHSATAGTLDCRDSEGGQTLYSLTGRTISLPPACIGTREALHYNP